jgi:hypothetical protein
MSWPRCAPLLVAAGAISGSPTAASRWRLVGDRGGRPAAARAHGRHGLDLPPRFGPRRADADRTRLYEQSRRWYELLVLGRDPTTYVKPYAILQGWRTSLHAVRACWPQLLLAVLGAAAVAAVVFFLATRQGSAVLTAGLGLMGALGRTAATVVAKAESAGRRLAARLRQDAYGDLVAIAVSNVPGQPDAGNQLPFGRPGTDQRAQGGAQPAADPLDATPGRAGHARLTPFRPGA